MPLTLVGTEGNKKKPLYKVNIFYNDRTTAGEATNWVCTRRRKEHDYCRYRVSTQNDKIIRTMNSHNHMAKDALVDEAEQLKNDIGEASVNTNEAPTNVLMQC